MSLPVDFETKVMLPPAVGGNGYPYKISARDLMANYKYLEDMWEEWDKLDVSFCENNYEKTGKILFKPQV